jgi:hypothetical protein
LFAPPAPDVLVWWSLFHAVDPPVMVSVLLLVTVLVVTVPSVPIVVSTEEKLWLVSEESVVLDDRMATSDSVLPVGRSLSVPLSLERFVEDEILELVIASVVL